MLFTGFLRESGSSAEHRSYLCRASRLAYADANGYTASLSNAYSEPYTNSYSYSHSHGYSHFNSNADTKS